MKKNILGLIVCGLLAGAHTSIQTGSSETSASRWVLPAVVVGAWVFYTWNKYKNTPQSQPVLQPSTEQSALKQPTLQPVKIDPKEDFAAVDRALQKINANSYEQAIKEVQENINQLEDKWQKEKDSEKRKRIDADRDKLEEKLVELQSDKKIWKARMNLVKSAKESAVHAGEKWQVEKNEIRKVGLKKTFNDRMKEYEKYKKEYDEAYAKLYLK
ncbi:MAG: LPS O-antigen subunit length determinant protein (WzzB/FepE family) [Alteromonas naphthalenivorans]|jgi:LPS O-antigen subunit length determinant protein (WzzB/FepE family)